MVPAFSAAAIQMIPDEPAALAQNPYRTNRIVYDAAVEEEDVTYAEEGGRVELQSDSGDYLEVIADSSDHGPIYCVCTIKNNDGVNSLKKSGGDEDHPEVMDLSTAFEKIPGFALICNS